MFTLNKKLQQIANFNLAYQPGNKQTVFIPFLIHTSIILFILFFLILTGKDYADYILRDDGYYRDASEFLKGNFDSGSGVGPILPLIFTPIHFFAEYLHPFIRIIISQFFVWIILFTLHKSTKNYLTNKQFLIGALLIVIHPTFVQWTFRTSIDLYLGAFMGLFILNYIRFFKTKNIFCLIYAFIIFGLSVFTRPSFMFIPLLLLPLALFYFKSKNQVVVNTALLIFAFSTFFLNHLYLQYNKTGQTEIVADTGGSSLFFHNLVLTEIILETKQFHKGTIDNYNVPEEYKQLMVSGKGTDYLNYRCAKERNSYWEKYPNGNTLHHIYIYASEKPQVVLAKVMLGPVFFFALSSRELVSYILLLFTILYMILTVWGLIINKLNLKKDNYLAVYLIILFGYFALHWAIHAYSRYSLAILPFLFIWTGFAIEKILNRVSNKIQPKSM